MQAAEILAALQEYRAELAAMLSRFTRTRDRVAIDPQDNFRLRALSTELIDLFNDHVPGSGQHSQMLANSFNAGVNNFYESSSYASVQEILGLVDAVTKRIERNPRLFAETVSPVGKGPDQRKLLDAIDQIILRFHAVVTQLRSRHAERPTLDVNDEYDVQDLMHALLRLHFDDVRPEEWTPSYAGASSRTDFLLPSVDTFIEVKKTRPGLSAKTVGEQLIIDIARYKSHPQCRRLVCFVYDPDGRITNPVGLETDLSAGQHGIEVRVSILPRP